MEDNKNNALAIGVTILSIGGVILIFKIFSKGGAFFEDILEKLGLKADKTDKDLEGAEKKADELGFFNPSFIRNAPAGTILLTKKNADIKARNLWDSVTLTWDYPEKMKAVFSNMITKSQVAHLSKVFKDTYNVDMLNWLVSKFDKDDQQKALTQVLQMLVKLPDYKSNKAVIGKTPVVIPPTIKSPALLPSLNKVIQTGKI